ncbi:MAG: hypothetical protein COZ06_02900 [Armatimonadetes bacterium CG_4_10_14_3_um_filter_66_18]|nr:hypothetical protein [Armatimonadota bacterium]OIP05320.1 MAG: hypothetical protein AUJ96_11100 [Armatimonadetes bacterium CG2_30_66_41]PIU88493.1 MAG: hypothetical protein COS65_30650 [Armatimonadetes bacterium CG06_land_8_20_14_3_00_66_21]PIW14431.1 MAG: hypothetical protein COW34_07650 [Armatimonadetes bacterium CG17_big_fil_post_rev_8_21_14_2_50_66_6]PIY52500.1 MAG: hypothetical protein COZ06_02900 [Armatimonadetes bacterium CG_4_10_14_3_um_filter_66_18]PIZ35288.1 MAG: hypothetical prot
MPSIVSPQLSKALHTFRCKLSLWVPSVMGAPCYGAGGGWGMLGVNVIGLPWLPEGPDWFEAAPPQYGDPQVYDQAGGVFAHGAYLLDTGCGWWEFDQVVSGSGGCYLGNFRWNDEQGNPQETLTPPPWLFVLSYGWTSRWSIWRVGTGEQVWLSDASKAVGGNQYSTSTSTWSSASPSAR